RTLVQFQKWDEILDEKTLPPFPRARQEAWLHWARAMAFAHKGELPAAIIEEGRFNTSLAGLKLKTDRPEPPELQVARKELAAHLEEAQGRFDASLKLFEEASKAERKLTYTEPPYYPRPVAEAMGHLALKNHRPEIAEKAYRIALEQYPADAHAERGLRAAIEQKSRSLAAAAR